jgi:hypothetical protein
MGRTGGALKEIASIARNNNVFSDDDAAAKAKLREAHSPSCGEHRKQG